MNWNFSFFISDDKYSNASLYEVELVGSYKCSWEGHIIGPFLYSMYVAPKQNVILCLTIALYYKAGEIMHTQKSLVKFTMPKYWKI